MLAIENNPGAPVAFLDPDLADRATLFVTESDERINRSCPSRREDGRRHRHQYQNPCGGPEVYGIGWRQLEEQAGEHTQGCGRASDTDKDADRRQPQVLPNRHPQHLAWFRAQRETYPDLRYPSGDQVHQ